MALHMALLAVDVGAGTQDILLCQEDVPLENSAKMVMPSQTVIVGKRIDRARSEGRDVFLTGSTMGGGPSTRAVRRHLDAGLRVVATPDAALTLNDNLDKVRAMGVEVGETASGGALRIETGDLDLSALAGVLELFCLERPGAVAVAVQDHGYAPERSNRIVRFEYMAEVLRSGGRPESFAHISPPPYLNRMCAVKRYLEGQGMRSLLMDTGPAALLGASLDPRYAEPALVLNLGNGHTIGAVMVEGRITALFEHHTSALTPEKLCSLAQRLCDGVLTNAEVFEDGGHGAHVEEALGKDGVRSVVVTGPNREPVLRSGLLRGLGEVVPAAPGGDMMITGCLGLVEAWKKLMERRSDG